MYLNAIPFNNYNPGKIPEYSTTTSYTEDAEDLFVDAKEKLLDVNNWKRYSGMSGIDFRLTDGHSRPVTRKAHRGDHIKIHIAGQGQGDQYCVRIDAIEYDDYPDLGMEAFTIRVHPCESPLSKHQGDEMDEAEGTLVVERRGKKIFASFQSRSETLNKDLAAGAAETNGWFGLSDVQWNSLVKGFVD